MNRDDERFNRHDMATAERLAALETRLEVVDEKIDDFRSDNDRRLDELSKVLNAVASRPDVLGWIKSNAKWIAIILGVLTGGTSLAEAFSLLGP